MTKKRGLQYILNLKAYLRMAQRDCMEQTGCTMSLEDYEGILECEEFADIFGENISVIEMIEILTQNA